MLINAHIEFCIVVSEPASSLWERALTKHSSPLLMKGTSAITANDSEVGRLWRRTARLAAQHTWKLLMGSKYICSISRSQSYSRAFTLQCNVFPNSFCQWTSNFLLREVNIKAPWAWDRKTTHSRALYNTELKRKPSKSAQTQRSPGERAAAVWQHPENSPLRGHFL